MQYTKGAPDVLLPLCTSYPDTARRLAHDGGTRAAIAAGNRTWPTEALRVLARAERTVRRAARRQEPRALEQTCPSSACLA